MPEKFEHPNMQKIETPSKCTDEEVAKLIEKYGADGLKEEGEYFIIEHPEEKRTTYLHKFKKIPQKTENGDVGYKDIETYIRSLLFPETEEEH